MAKLISKYRETPSLANAQRIRAYHRAHPMASCLLTIDESDTVADAIAHANCGHR